MWSSDDQKLTCAQIYEHPFKGKFKRKKRPKEEIESIYGLFPEANLTSYKNVYNNYIEKLTKLEKLNKEAKCLSSEKEGVRL